MFYALRDYEGKFIKKCLGAPMWDNVSGVKLIFGFRLNLRIIDLKLKKIN